MKKIFLLFIVLNTILIGGVAQNGFSTYTNSIISVNMRTCLRQDPAGNKWIGTTSKGVYEFDGVNWLVYDMSNSGIASNVVNDVTFSGSNTVWFATRAGVSKLSGGAWTTYNVSNSGLLNDTTNCIFSTGGTIWVGTKRGLSKFDGTSWTTFNTSNSGLINNFVTTINADVNGNIWVGTSTGLCVKTASGWVTYDNNNSNFVSDQVNVIYIENANTKWIGTKNAGLFKFENGIFYSCNSLFRDKEGIYFYTINSISKGPQGGVLISQANQFTTVAQFYELVGAQIYTYTFPASYYSYFHVFDNATNKVWFLNKSGSSTNSTNTIFCFDYASFTGSVLVPKIWGLESLDVNQVKALLQNRGDLHWDGDHAGYEVPKNSGRNAIFTSALWIGGLDNGGNLHQAAMTYRQTGNDYWPGPLDTLSGTTDSVTAVAYDTIWKLDRRQIDEFRAMFANGSVGAGTYTPAYNILHWPAHGGGNYTRNMAPFVDVNGDGNYNPLADGDYPKIKGDQMCYWVFNDNLRPHTETGGQPLKVEVHASAYAYACDSIADSLKVLNYATFYDYEIYNRSSADYHNTYISLWQDNDLGGYDDDYLGCNPAGNYSFVYNGDSADEGLNSVLGYGVNPPMYSNVILNGPLAVPGDGIDNDNDGIVDEAGEKDLMTNVLNYNNNSNPVNGNPGTAAHFYNYMQNKWRDGSPVVYGGTGTGSGTPYSFMYDGVPTLPGWSAATLNNPFIDNRIVMSCGPFNLNAASHVNFSFAVVYTRDDQSSYNILHLYNKNLADVNRIKEWYANDNFPSCDPIQPAGISEKNEPLKDNFKIYPNPASQLIYIDCKTVSQNLTIKIYNIQGQLIKSVSSNRHFEQGINIDDLSNGLYIIKISDGKNSDVQRFVKH